VNNELQLTIKNNTDTTIYFFKKYFHGNPVQAKHCFGFYNEVENNILIDLSFDNLVRKLSFKTACGPPPEIVDSKDSVTFKIFFTDYFTTPINEKIELGAYIENDTFIDCDEREKIVLELENFKKLDLEIKLSFVNNYYFTAVTNDTLIFLKKPFKSY